MADASLVNGSGDGLFSLVKREEKLLVDSRDIAISLNIQHKNFLSTIETYKTVIEKKFGRVAFETDLDKKPVNGGWSQKYALLTEDQSLFIGTLSRNSDEVVEFKARLVSSFQNARRTVKALMELSTEEQLLMLAKALVKKDEDFKQVEFKNKVLLVENQAQKEKIEADAPKVQFAETVNQATNSIDMGIVAKMINKHDKNCGKNRLFKFLRDKNILMENNIPYQPYNRYFEVVEIPKVINQEIIMIPKTQVKPNGQHYIINKWFEAFPEKKPVDHRKETTLLDFCE